MSEEIGFTCSPAPGAAIENADQICREFLGALQAARTDLRFVSRGPGAPAAEVRITHANSRGLGLNVTWIDGAGSRTAGTPLNVSFFDRGSDAGLRRNFYTAFLTANPVPF